MDRAVVLWCRILTVAGLLALPTCTDLQQPGQFSSTKTGPLGFASFFQVPTTVDQTLERAPEIFRESGVARWSGGKTVPGIWVTHPNAAATRRVRIVNTRTGAEIDGMLYKTDGTGPKDSMTVSSDAAEALALTPDLPTLLSVFGLKPISAASQARASSPQPVYDATPEVTARSELANHISRMDGNQILQLVAAAVRGMGYATQFEAPSTLTPLSEIRAFPGLDEKRELAPIRVIVRPVNAAPMTNAEVARAQIRLSELGEVGAIVSVSGFASGAERGLTLGKAHLEMVDLDGLLEIWKTNYERLSEPDRALLPVQPVYFLAGFRPPL